MAGTRDAADAASGTPSGHVRARRALHPVDVVVLVALVATGVHWFRLTDGSWFFFDEWALAPRGRSAGDFLEPYNGHLSTTYIAIYRAHFAVFGFDQYAVLRAIGVTALLSVPALYHLTTRGRWGPGPAALVAVGLLWTRGVTLEPGGMNHTLTLAAGVVVAAALMRSGRWADLVVAAGLLVALATSGGGVPVAAAALVHAAITRAPARRWVAVAVPTALWVAWWLAHREASPLAEEHRLDLAEKAELVLRGQVETFEHLAGGSAVAGWLLVGGVALVLVQRLRTDHLTGAATVLPWVAADVVWWWGLAQSRGVAATPETFRYRFVTGTYLALAMVPHARSSRDRWPGSVPAAARPWLQAAGVAAVLGLLVGANGGAVRDHARMLESFGGAARRTYVVATGVPGVLPEGYVHNLAMGALTQRQMTEVAQAYGPRPGSAEEVDRLLVRHGAVTVEVAPATSPPGCPTVTAPVPAPGPEVVLRTRDVAVDLAVRRYGTELVPVTRIPARSTAVVRLASELPTAARWWVAAPGACAG